MAAPSPASIPESACRICGGELPPRAQTGDACPKCGSVIALPPAAAQPAGPTGPAELIGPADAPATTTWGALLEILRIAAPSVATMTSYTLMQFVDAIIISGIDKHDPIALSAQGNGGLAAWIPMSFMAGLLGVVNTYVAQNLGAGRPERGPAYAWNALWLAALGAILMLPLALAMPQLYALAGHAEPRLVQEETRYAQILMAGAFLSMSVRGLAQFFYGIHRPWVVLVSAVAGNVVNLGANWVLVYGKFGFPALGIAGSAIGTVIGSAVELAIPMLVFLSASWDRQYQTRATWRPSWPHIRDILRIGWPGALMLGNEMICWGFFMVVLVGRFGPEQNTASWIGLRYMHVAFMPAVGVSFAMTAIIGRYLGMKRPDLALSRAKVGIGLTMAYMGVCGLCFLLFRNEMAGFFTESPEIREAGGRIILLAAAFQLFDALGITIVGILRGAGDTVWPGVATVGLSWICLVGVGYGVSHAWPQLGAVGPWIGGAVYIILLGIFLGYRFVYGDWRTRTVLDPPVGGH